MRRLLTNAAVAIMATIGWASPGTATTHLTTDDAVARTDSGKVRGVVADDYRLFQGIPFAKPPVGELRWRSPRRPDRWPGVRDATKQGNRCAQLPPGGSEDCLYLNVTTPRTKGLKPVVVWLHGGGLSFGSANDFDARRFATLGDVVVVSPNYRLSVFGFFGHRGLPGSGGFGLEDQQAALTWVKRNIASFGGDPRRVTLMGESGGAQAVCQHLAAPSSRGLFDRAIMQSGSCSMTFPLHGLTVNEPAGGPLVPLRDAEKRGADAAAKLGCTDPRTAIACLRTKPAAELVTTWQGAVIQTPAAYGGRVLPTDPRIVLARGDFHRVPVITGTTRDEATLSAGALPRPFTDSAYRGLLGEAFDDDAGAIAAKYAASGDVSPGQAWSNVMTDRVFTCNQLEDARLLARWTPTYVFEFSDPTPPTGYFTFPDDVEAGAFHSSEVAYFFAVAFFETHFTPEQERLVAAMIGYWSRFAASGNPNGDGLPKWRRLDRANAQSLAPDAIGPVNVAVEHRCAFWADRI